MKYDVTWYDISHMIQGRKYDMIQDNIPPKLFIYLTWHDICHVICDMTWYNMKWHEINEMSWNYMWGCCVLCHLCHPPLPSAIKWPLHLMKEWTVMYAVWYTALFSFIWGLKILNCMVLWSPNLIFLHRNIHRQLISCKLKLSTKIIWKDTFPYNINWSLIKLVSHYLKGCNNDYI